MDYTDWKNHKKLKPQAWCERLCKCESNFKSHQFVKDELNLYTCKNCEMKLKEEDFKYAMVSCWLESCNDRVVKSILR